MQQLIEGQHSCKGLSTAALCNAQGCWHICNVYMLLLAIICEAYEGDATSCLATAVELTRQQALMPTCCRRLYKGILEANDEGVNEPAQYAYLPQHTLGLLWTAQHVWYPFDSNLSSSFCLLFVGVHAQVVQKQSWTLIS